MTETRSSKGAFYEMAMGTDACSRHLDRMYNELMEKIGKERWFGTLGHQFPGNTMPNPPDDQCSACGVTYGEWSKADEYEVCTGGKP